MTQSVKLEIEDSYYKNKKFKDMSRKELYEVIKNLIFRQEQIKREKEHERQIFIKLRK